MGEQKQEYFLIRLNLKLTKSPNLHSMCFEVCLFSLQLYFRRYWVNLFFNEINSTICTFSRCTIVILTFCIK
jgi:hypothetical protein